MFGTVLFFAAGARRVPQRMLRADEAHGGYSGLRKYKCPILPSSWGSGLRS